MDQTYISALAELGVSLATMAASGTATAINSKIKAIKAEKDSEKIRNAYEEIINELIAEREELLGLLRYTEQNWTGLLSVMKIYRIFIRPFRDFWIL